MSEPESKINQIIKKASTENKVCLFTSESRDPKGAREYVKKFRNGLVKYDLIKAVDLKLRGFSITEILAVMKPKNDTLSENGLKKVLDKYAPDIDLQEIAVYQEYRKKLMNAVEKKALEKLNKKLDGPEAFMTLDSITRAYSSTVEKRRLEEDKSTANIATKHSTIIKNIMRKRRQELQGEDEEDPVIDG